jgi:hypothetical protein
MTAATTDLAVPGSGGARRVLPIVFGALLALLGAGLLVGGGAMLWLDQVRRDDSCS